MKKRIYCITTALCLVLCIVLCIAFAAVCSKAENSKTLLPEVRNNGTAIQWRDTAEEKWQYLVALNTLRGTDGKNGLDGKDGTDGKTGLDGKNIEVQRTTEYIQWRYEGEDWQNLVAISDIKGPTGQNGKDGANGKTPEFRVNENNLQRRYVRDEIWYNLYDLSI